MEARLEAHGDLDLMRCYLHAPTNVGASTSLQLQCATFDLSFAVEKLEYVRGHASMTPEYHELLHSCELAVETCSEKLTRFKALAYDDLVASAQSRKRKMVEAAASDVRLTMPLPDAVVEVGHDLQDACVRLLNTRYFGYISDYDSSTRQYKIVLDADDMVEYHPFQDFALVAPKKNDRILVVIGEGCRSQTGKLIGIDGDDRILKIGEDIRIVHASCIAKIRELSDIK